MAQRSVGPVVDHHGVATRALSNPEQLRALAHPRRLQILDLLLAQGPLTATQCAAALRDSPASASYHLRQLARFGFIEEAAGGRGRNRPWQRVPLGNRIQPPTSPAEESAAEALSAAIDSHNLERIRHYLSHRNSDAWKQAAGLSDWAVRVTEEELKQLSAAIDALIAPLQQRTFDRREPPGTRLVDVLTYLLPRPQDVAAATSPPPPNDCAAMDASNPHRQDR